MRIDLSPLRPYCNPVAEAITRAGMGNQPAPKHVLSGVYEGVSFVVTQDADGHTEASLAGAMRAPTEVQINRFFGKAWKRKRPQSVPLSISGGRGFHWVVT